MSKSNWQLRGFQIAELINRLKTQVLWGLKGTLKGPSLIPQSGEQCV